MIGMLHWLRDHLSPERRGYRRFDPSQDDTIVCLRAKGVDAVRSTRRVRRERQRLHTIAEDIFPSCEYPRKDAQ